MISDIYDCVSHSNVACFYYAANFRYTVYEVKW